MRKLPDCPKCQEDELWLQPTSGSLHIRCYECGWGGEIVTCATGPDLDAQIAAVIRAAKEPDDPPHGFYAGTNPPYTPDDSPIATEEEHG